MVIANAVFAAFASYQHIEHLTLKYGQPLSIARLMPASIDGVILAASLIMLYLSRRKITIPFRVRAVLWSGVILTLGANAIEGLPFGVIGIVLSTLSGASFVVLVEILMWFVHETRRDKSVTPLAGLAGGDEEQQGEAVIPNVPSDRYEAARVALEATIQAGNPFSQRQMMARFGLGRLEEIELRAAVETKLSPPEPEREVREEPEPDRELEAAGVGVTDPAGA